MVKVCDAPLARFPIVQVGADQDPADNVGEPTAVYPVGSTSVTTTPVVAYIPLLVAVNVKVMFVPTFGVELLTVLIILISVGQFSVFKVLEVLMAGPPQGSVITYCTTTAPKPVNVKLFPIKVPGPLTSESVPPAGKGFKVAEDPTQ